MADEPDLRPRVYWLVAILAVVVMLLLGWLTSAFHIARQAGG